MGLYPRRVIVAVARGWTDEDLVGDVLAKIWHEDPEAVLVHRSDPRRNADAMAVQFWRDWGLKEESHPATVDLFAAGVDKVIVFLVPDGDGARDLADAAERRGIEVKRYNA